MKNNIEKRADVMYKFVTSFMFVIVGVQIGFLGFICYAIYKVLEHYGIV